MTTLDALLERGVKKGGRGCRYPGCVQPTRAVVHIALRRFKEGEHVAGKFDGSVARQVSLCESHAVEVWQALLTPMEDIS